MINLQNPTKKIVVLGCQYTLSIEELKRFKLLIPLIKDWHKLYQILIRTQTALFFYKNILNSNSKNEVPDFFVKNLKEEYIKNCIRNAKKNHDYQKLKAVLTSNSITLIPLKGGYLNQFVYQDSGVRPMSDIDVLIQKSDIEKVKELILTKGWEMKVFLFKSKTLERISKNITHHPYSITTGDTNIELHIGIHNAFRSFNVNINDYWKRSKTIVEKSNQASYLDKTDCLQHLCLHAYSDMISSILKLRNFVDIIEFVKLYRSEIDWKKLYKTSKEYNCLNEISQVLKICVKYFKLKIDHEITGGDETKKISTVAEMSFLNMFSTNLYSQIFFIWYKIKGRLACYYKKTKNAHEIIDLTLGFVFPNPSYINDQYNKQNKSKFIYHSYKLLKLIK